MSPLSSCWLIIELIIIPEGILKWFYLSFYIHPVFLVFCQLFLWAKQLHNLVILVVNVIYRIIFFVGVHIYRTLKRCFLYISPFSVFFRAEKGIAEDHQELSFKLLPDNNNTSDTEEKYHVSDVSSNVGEASISLLPRIYFIEFPTRLVYTLPLETVESVDHFEVEEIGKCSIEHHSDGYRGHVVAESVNSSDESSMDSWWKDQSENAPYSEVSDVSDQEIDNMQSAPPMSIMDFLANQQDQLEDDSASGEDIDQFYLEYTERMAWFDVLSQERLCGINAIEKKNESAGNILMEQVAWNKMAKKTLMDSMESDIELVYVAQTCLSWEALHHQYLKVEALSVSSSGNGVFRDNVAGRFQQFQVLLERFVEDGLTSNAKRYWDYTLKRSSIQEFLHVPKVSGFLSSEDESRIESTKITDVMKAIERCIQAYWAYMIADTKQTWWKSTSLLWKSRTPPVEDARDLNLWHELINELKKKERCLKDLKASKKRHMKNNVANSNMHERWPENDVRLSMIDMMIVKRVLKLSVVSHSQLKWCHEKLASMNFQGGTIIRRQGLDDLFPSS